MNYHQVEEIAINKITCQEGYQMKALSSQADIVIGGGSAGAGKTYCLLLSPVEYLEVKGFGGVIFRRTSPQIRNEGGLWDTSMELYPHLEGTPKESTLEWEFKNGVEIKFKHLQHEKNIYDWQGAQIPFIGFDELTHFSEKMFFYLLSRSRSTCGVNPFVRATCNPDPDSWVAKLIEWWIDDSTGLPIPERDGVIRYFIKNNNEYIWGDTKEEVIEKAWFFLEEMIVNTDGEVDPKDLIKSITFIAGSVYGNKKLLKVNPQYLANLVSQDEDTKAMLLKGSWKMQISDKDLYNYIAFQGMFNSFIDVRNGTKYVSADIALKGSDKFVVGVWDGFELIDIAILPKSNGKEVIDVISNFLKLYQIPNRNMTYDNDGVGGFIDGFIVGSIPFLNGGKPFDGENYVNLKTQCYYKSSDRVNNNGYRISEKVANTMYDNKMTIRQRFIYERKAIKRAKMDNDGKLTIVGKDEMKAMLNGDSPDLMDMFMMRERFEFAPVPITLKWY